MLKPKSGRVALGLSGEAESTLAFSFQRSAFKLLVGRKREVIVKIRVAAFLATISCPALNAIAAAPDGYQISQSIALRSDRAGCTCSVEVLEDDRLTDPIRKDIAENGNVNLGDDESRDLYSAFDKIPMQDAIIQVVDRRGEVLDRRAFDAPIAEIGDQALALTVPGTTYYSLTVDRRRGELYFSSLAGYYFTVINGKFQWMHYIDDLTNEHRDLGTSSNVRIAYSIVDRVDGKGKDFLLVQCDFNASNPVSPDDKFTTIYTRVHFVHGAWHARRKSKIGYCEENFPSIESFPRF